MAKLLDLAISILGLLALVTHVVFAGEYTKLDKNTDSAGIEHEFHDVLYQNIRKNCTNSIVGSKMRDQ